jgi:hypothetical protein
MASVSNDTGKIEEVELTDLGNMHKRQTYPLSNALFLGTCD